MGGAGFDGVALQGVGAGEAEIRECTDRFVEHNPATKELEQVPGKPAEATTKAEAIGSVQVASNPDGADVYADGVFAANAPGMYTPDMQGSATTVRLAWFPFRWAIRLDSSSGSQSC